MSSYCHSVPHVHDHIGCFCLLTLFIHVYLWGHCKLCIKLPVNFALYAKNFDNLALNVSPHAKNNKNLNSAQSEKVIRKHLYSLCLFAGSIQILNDVKYKGVGETEDVIENYNFGLKLHENCM